MHKSNYLISINRVSPTINYVTLITRKRNHQVLKSDVKMELLK